MENRKCGNRNGGEERKKEKIGKVEWSFLHQNQKKLI